MKKPRHNKTALVSNSRWFAYAAAGAATTLGAAQSAEAEIHYSGVINGRLGEGNGIHAIIPLRHSARLRFSEFTYQLFFSVDGAAVSNAFCVYKATHRTLYVSRLPQGAVISNQSFVSRVGTFLIISPYSFGPWLDKGLGFIGFRFNNGSGMQYGWARVKVPGAPYSYFHFILVDYAWGDPGDRVRAGQTSSTGNQVHAVPEEGSLGLLALGGAGLVAWRRRRQS